MAGENLDLKIIIDTLLNSKGFEEAQAGLKTLAGATNAAGDEADKSGKKQKGLAKELGGSRGAVADLTRVMLMNIGVTGAAGETAKAAGLAMNLLGGSASLVAFGAAGLVAGLAFLIPKLVEWAGASGKAEEEQKKIRDAVIAELPQLEELAEKIGKVNQAINLQVEAIRKQALDKQAETIEQYTRQIVELQHAAQALQVSIGNLEVLERLMPSPGLTKRMNELREELRKQNIEIDRQSAVLMEAQDAAEKGITADRVRLNQAKEADRKNKDLRISQEAYTKAIKEWEFAERSAAIAREKQKKQETEEIARENKLIQLLHLEANAKRDAARAAIDAEADRIEAETAAGQRSMDIKKEAIAMGLAAASSAFASNKALAIAAAIADTYAGATAALGMKPWTPANFAMAAAVVAQGLANVANIRKAQPGFDDPFSDMLASKLGRKSAADFVQHFGAGFREGMGGGRGGGTSITNINRGTTMNVTANGVIGSRTAFRSWLEREMTLAERVRRRKSI